MVSFLTTAVVPDDQVEDAVDFIRASSKFSLIAGHLYYRDQDEVLKLVVCPEEYFQILRDAHVLSCGQHLSKDQTVRIVSGKVTGGLRYMKMLPHMYDHV